MGGSTVLDAFWSVVPPSSLTPFVWLAFAVRLVTLSFDWLAFAVKLVRATEQVLPRMPANQMRVLPVHR